MPGHVDDDEDLPTRRDKKTEELKRYIEEERAALERGEDGPEEKPGTRSLIFGPVRTVPQAPPPPGANGHRGERRPKALLRTDKEAVPSVAVNGEEYLTTTEAAKYCRFRTPGGLRKAWHALLVFPCGRRGGRNMLLWEKKELDRFCRGQPLLQSQAMGVLMPPHHKMKGTEGQ